MNLRGTHLIESSLTENSEFTEINKGTKRCLLLLEGTIPHAARGRDGRQECRECSY